MQLSTAQLLPRNVCFLADKTKQKNQITLKTKFFIISQPITLHLKNNVVEKHKEAK